MTKLTRLRRVIDQHPTILDWTIVAVFCALTFMTLRLAWTFGSPVSWPEAVGLSMVLILPLGWRRTHPLAVLVFMTLVLMVMSQREVPALEWPTNSWWVALYSAGVYGQSRFRNKVRLAAILALSSQIIYELFTADLSSFEGSVSLLRAFNIFANGVLFAAAWWFGDSIRARREREAELAERTSQLEIEREENAQRAVMDERVRIARELHDVVAHHVSVMGIQAGAARRVLRRQPAKAEEALALIESSSREVVLEMHRLIGFLRQEADVVSLSAQPTLKRLDELANQMRESGLEVDVHIRGEERSLPPGVELSAFRIIQEALTNTLKHAPGAKATVDIAYQEGLLDLAIVDDGNRTPVASGVDGSGHGLMGMRERVTLLGGELDAGYRPGEGFAVRARLPFEGYPG